MFQASAPSAIRVGLPLVSLPETMLLNAAMSVPNATPGVPLIGKSFCPIIDKAMSVTLAGAPPFAARILSLMFSKITCFVSLGIRDALPSLISLRASMILFADLFFLA